MGGLRCRPTNPTTILCWPRERRRWCNGQPETPGRRRRRQQKPYIQSSALTDLLRTCYSWRPECNPMDVVAIHRTLFAHTHTLTQSRNNNINIAVYAHTLTHTHTHGRNAADAFAAKTFVFRRTDD